jgi:AsmA protein
VLKIPREGADATQMQDMVDAQIPVKVSGSLSDPKVRPDLENYLKGEVKKKVEEKLKDKLGDKLKDIFKKKQ